MVYIPDSDTAPVFPGSFTGFHDTERVAGSNGAAPPGDLVARYADALNAIAHSPRMLRTFWLGDKTTNNNALRRFIWTHNYQPAGNISGELLVLPNSGTRSATQGVYLTVDSQDPASSSPENTTFVVDYDVSGRASSDFEECTALQQYSFKHQYSAGSVRQVAVGSTTANGPGLISGMLYEPANLSTDPTVANRYAPHQHVAAGMDIVGVGVSGGANHLDTLRSMFNHVWNRKRPGIGWERMAPDAAPYVDFNTAKTSYRYIHDQTIGTGGTATSTTGPGITFPLPNATSGINTTLKMAVWVYAAMSGATNTGTIAVSNKAAGGGSMTSIAAVSGISVSGTTYQWYPNTGYATFDARADLAFDRIVLCGKSSGSTDSLRVEAYYMTPVPSLNIT